MEFLFAAPRCGLLPVAFAKIVSDRKGHERQQGLDHEFYEVRSLLECCVRSREEEEHGPEAEGVDAAEDKKYPLGDRKRRLLVEDDDRVVFPLRSFDFALQVDLGWLRQFIGCRVVHSSVIRSR